MKYKNKVVCKMCGGLNENGVVLCECGNRLIHSVTTAVDGSAVCNLTDTADTVVLAKSLFGSWHIVRYGEMWDSKGDVIPTPSTYRRPFKFVDFDTKEENK